ncbi:C40 family peptidase [Streptomyces sp. BI20]|uniref:C40 family peptidase n=1 Tax=Streptomyces sp. BI20 TaxID=3403460 RepID=UPI003C77AAEA
MSHTAHIPSHRKPRRSASKLAVRAGVAGGVLSTLAMAGTASATPSPQPVTETLEMPVLDLDLGTEVSSAVTTAADNSRAAALQGELTQQQNEALSGAAAEAKEAKQAAQEKAEEDKKAQEEAEKAAAEESRASRGDDRTELTSTSGSGSNSGSDDSSTPSKGSGSGSTGSNTGSSSNTGSLSPAINFAYAQVGKAYVMGGTGPSSYDCSGLVQAAYRAAGITLPRTSQAQSNYGTEVSLSNLQPGDILYWGGKGSAYHVALYVGGGKFVGAQNPSTGIVERPMSYDMPSGAVRVR